MKLNWNIQSVAGGSGGGGESNQKPSLGCGYFLAENSVGNSEKAS